MDGLTAMAMVVIALVVLGAAAAIFGMDSRESFNEDDSLRATRRI